MFGVPLSDDSCIDQWYQARDMLVGSNHVKQNVRQALILAAGCKHSEACWLTDMFSGKCADSSKDVRMVLLGHGDAKSVCFAALLTFPKDVSCLRRSAQLGYAFAQSEMASATRGIERFQFAHGSALQGERDGFRWLGDCFLNGEGCQKDLAKAKDCFLEAAKHNDVCAMIRYSRLLKFSNPQRWKWWARATALGDSESGFLAYLPGLVQMFNSDPALHASCVFAVGQALKGEVNMKTKEIFGGSDHFDDYVGPALQAIEFYDAQCSAARAAINWWVFVALRVSERKVNKDIRRKIGELIWDARCLAEYPKGRPII